MSVISFGVNKQSQLGHALEKDHLDPSVIQNLSGMRIVMSACGEAHSLAVTEFGDVYSFGRGREGQLGHPEKYNTAHPNVITALAHERITRVACGNFHSLALTDTGKIYEWGQLHEIDKSAKGLEAPSGLIEMKGIGFASRIAEQSLSQYLSGDKAAYDPTSKNISNVNSQSAQNEDAEDLTNKDEEFDAAAGSGGDDSQNEQKGKHIGKIVDRVQLTPLLVGSIKNQQVVDMSAGWAYSAAVTKSGKVFTWGFNEKGQLGLGDRWFHGLPQQVKFFTNVHIVSVSCGRQHIGVISDQGDLFTWGLGVFGQLGHGKLKSCLHPKKVLAFSEADQLNQKVRQVACGANFTMALTVDGRLWSFGHGEYGQLGATEENQYRDWNRGGNGNGNEREAHLQYAVPQQVEALASVKVKQVTCGHLHTIVVTEDNDVYSWGWGASGCLGFGDRKFQLVPQRVPALSGEIVSSISAGEKHSLVVRSTDTTTFAFDYRNLLNDKKHSDIVFLVQDKKVYANKFIIKSRCPRLYSTILLDKRYGMLQDLSGQDKPMRQITIANVKYQVWTSFLTYLYTDHLVIPPHLRKELADVAVKWGVSRLASLCLRYNYRLRMAEGIPPSTFSHDITQHLGSFDYTDINFQLISSSDIIPSHKCILASRNPYFKTMFECGFREKDQVDFKVGDDIDKETFKTMIEYIYGSNDSIVNQDNAVDLLCLADRFMVQDLKLVTEHYLRQIVQSNNSMIKLFISQQKQQEKSNNNNNNNQSPSPTPSTTTIATGASGQEQMATELLLLSTSPTSSIDAPLTPPSPKEEEEEIITLEDAKIAFDNICLLLQVADRFLAKRLKSVCMETISQLSASSPEHFNVFNKSNETLKVIRCASPSLIRELDHYASANYGQAPNYIMTLTR
ncbi:regulator of chromosome condensation domain-containing protein [Cavenderia fasciculata]|uniref:Regulator of chromosome condensation domain-containing protein n=1 Tax=Cavenderia fasciculata TaxID=261658 RepID=F4PQK6_CACFS|nr:regulator of chromosome condensation domain-containing protein [Cavenderia fasciculata]EGG21173.1 regulator of chromosome condensation domain-containing protein [Cavenderia fasciculata]|eukprot:XP_004359023.1 regulator of chromosome condensation domain-containing protein [Cavenderia fasciculata]